MLVRLLSPPLAATPADPVRWPLMVRTGSQTEMTGIGVEHSPETGRADDSF